MKLLKYTLLLIVLLGISRLLAQPAAPQNLTASSVTFQFEGTTKTAVKLQWDKVKDSEDKNVPIYEIFRKDGDAASSNEFISLGEVLWASNKFDSDVTLGNTYTYYVIAKDFSNNTSGPSEYAEITVGDDPIGGGNSSIAGTVTDAESNLPLQNVYVVLVSTSSLSVKTVMTDVDGNYVSDVLPGEYIVYFRAAQDYYPQYYNNAKHVWEATRISLNDGETLTGIDGALMQIKMGPMLSISGNVSDNLGNPIKSRVDVFVDMFDRSVKRHFSARTDDNGDYTVMVPESLTVVVFAKPVENGFFGEFYNNTYSMTSAERIQVNSDITGIDFVLEEQFEGGATVAGMVQNSETEFVESMVVAVRLGAERHNRQSNLRTFTEEGAFNFSNLLPGDYIFYVVPEEGYLPTFYKENGETTNKWKEADVLTLDNNSVENIVFNLTDMPERPSAAFGEISGLVVDDNSQPVSEAMVLIYDAQNNVAGSSLTNGEGKYSITNLETGFYSISCSNYGLSYEENTNVFVGIDNQSSSNFVLTPDIPVSVEEGNIADEYYLNQNYPNPFNPTTNIEFAIKEQSNVELKIYDILGAEISTLIKNELPSGNYKVEFNAVNMPTGLYIYQLKTENFVQSRKMMLIK